MSQNKNVESRVERHVFRGSDPYYLMLKHFCHLSKNLYNHANYVIRQSFISGDGYLSYNTVDKLMKSDYDFPDYHSMPTVHSAQQTLRFWIRTGNLILKLLKIMVFILRNILESPGFQSI